LQHLLLIVDACFAGAGVLDLTSAAQSLEKEWPLGIGREYHLLVSARHRDEAQQGKFARAFGSALKKLSESSGTTTEHIRLGEVVRSTNLLLEQLGAQHRAEAWPLVQTAGGEIFFENPMYAVPAATSQAAQVVSTDEYL